MSQAKLGRVYSESHKLSICVGQIIRWARHYHECPVRRTMSNDTYSEEYKLAILTIMARTEPLSHVSTEGWILLNEL